MTHMVNITSADVNKFADAVNNSVDGSKIERTDGPRRVDRSSSTPSRSFRRRQQRLLQKYNFKASWMNRGLTDVFEICPNVLVANVVSGALNCGVLSRLRNSARNSIRLLSPEPSGIFLITDI